MSDFLVCAEMPSMNFLSGFSLLWPLPGFSIYIPSLASCYHGSRLNKKENE